MRLLPNQSAEWVSEVKAISRQRRILEAAALSNCVLLGLARGTASTQVLSQLQQSLFEQAALHALQLNTDTKGCKCLATTTAGAP